MRVVERILVDEKFSLFQGVATVKTPSLSTKKLPKCSGMTLTKLLLLLIVRWTEVSVQSVGHE